MEISLVSQNSISEILSRIFRKTSKSITPTFYRYSDIPLRVYIDIAATGNYNLLTRTGRPTKEESVEAWELIVKQNSNHSGDFQYDSYFTLIQAYYQFVCEYTLVRNMLLKLSTVIDYEFVEACRARGYAINLKDSRSYEKSIAAALRRTANLITRARMKQSEIEREFGNKHKKSFGFEETMANLTMALGFVVADDITLARYNEYKKMIKSRSDKNKKENGRVQS